MIDFNERNLSGGNVFPKSDEKWRREKVLEDLAASKTNYFYLGAHLLDIWLTRTYAVHKFDVSNYSGANFFDYCKVYFGLYKSQVSRYMNIVSEFGDGLRGFKDEYKEYSYSLLTEMLSLTPEQRKKVKANWTIKQIREYKKELAGVVATSQPKEKVTKLYGEIKASEKSKTILLDVLPPHVDVDENNLREYFDEFGKEFFVGYDYDGYGLSFSDKVRILFSLACFAQDISIGLQGSRFVNIFETFSKLKKLGYLPTEK